MESTERKSKAIYKRVLLKLSGEALAHGGSEILDADYLHEIASVIKRCVDEGVQMGIIVGAGNIWRGRAGGEMNRVTADSMGMLATCINALALMDAFSAVGLDARVMSAVPMDKFAEYYTSRAATEHLEKGRVVIFACGLGSPYFSTDTPAVVRAMEINADVILLAKNVDCLYTDDPRKNPDAERIERTTYRYIVDNRLSAIDMTASVLSEDSGIPSVIFGLDDASNIYKVIVGEKSGTVIE